MKLVPLYEEFLRYMLTEKNCSKATEDTYRRDFKRLKIADGHQLHNTVSGSAKAVTGRGGKWVDL